MLVGYLATPLRPASRGLARRGRGRSRRGGLQEAPAASATSDDLSEQQRLSAAAWGRTVDKMVRWGAKVTAEDKPALVAYLTSRWGHP